MTTIPNPRERLLWLAVDFDGTLAVPAWTPETPYAVGDPITANIDKLRAAYDRGWKIIIHTARAWEHYEIVESWLHEHRIPFDKIICGKLLAAAYIDDRGVHSDAPVWQPPGSAY